MTIRGSLEDCTEKSSLSLGIEVDDCRKLGEVIKAGFLWIFENGQKDV